jgi:hypothetical protein
MQKEGSNLLVSNIIMLDLNLADVCLRTYRGFHDGTTDGIT